MIKTKYILLLLIGVLQQCAPPKESEQYREEQYIIDQKDKHRGLHVFGRLDSINIKPIQDLGADWITLVPFASQEDHESVEVISARGAGIDTIRRDSMWRSRVDLAHQAGMKVMIKPHLWLYSPIDGKWRSDVYPVDDRAWERWKVSYQKFILRYARMAEQSGAELFCIGAELTRLTLEKSEYWKDLIYSVRAVYSGQLTYAANWYEEYEHIDFWDELDYIGVQAYFPLVNHDKPSMASIRQGWQKYMVDMEKVSEKYNRPILFTELGYKSTKNAASEPWEWIDYESDDDTMVSLETQKNSYKAFFDEIWDQPWFAGVHIWQWRCDWDGVLIEGSKHMLDFTPQSKPVEELIKSEFMVKAKL